MTREIIKTLNEDQAWKLRCAAMHIRRTLRGAGTIGYDAIDRYDTESSPVIIITETAMDALILDWKSRLRWVKKIELDLIPPWD